MRRVYVIMVDKYDEDNQFISEPVDVVYTMDEAETVCFELETVDPHGVYYWREIVWE